MALSPTARISTLFIHLDDDVAPKITLQPGRSVLHIDQGLATDVALFFESDAALINWLDIARANLAVARAAGPESW